MDSRPKRQSTPDPSPDAGTARTAPIQQTPNVSRTKPNSFGRRHFTVVLLFLGMANAYVMRTNMSVAVVSMANPLTRGRMHEWSPFRQGIVLGSFFFGYVTTQIPFGLLTKKYDSVKILGFGMLINSAFSLLVPVSSEYFWALFLARFVQGLGEGPIVPCTHAILAKWIPPKERSLLAGIVYAGAQFGTIISYPASGYLANGRFFDGWPAIFYVFGIVCLGWCVVFLTMVSENPSIDPYISEEEKDYIVYSIFGGNIIDDLKDSKVPWYSIFHSGPFLAILAAHLGHNFGYETLMTMLPTFLKIKFNFNLKTNGVISATPYLAMFISSMLLSVLANWLIVKRVLSTGATRKLMTGIGMISPGMLYILAVLLNFTKTATLSCIILGMSCNGGIYSGFKINHIDISPCFAGVLMSFTNCAANVLGMFAAPLAGALRQLFEDDTVMAWKIVFLISGLMYISCATVYIIFSSGKKQEWDRKTTDEILRTQSH